MFTENINIRLAQTELDSIFFGGSITTIRSRVADNYERDMAARYAKQDKIFRAQSWFLWISVGALLLAILFP